MHACTFAFEMVTLKKILSTFLMVALLVAVTGVSFSRHICLSGKSVACPKNNYCCKDRQHSAMKKMKCCAVQNFYFKANIVSTHDSVNQKFFPENFIAVFQNHFFISPSQFKYVASDLIPKPPLLRNSRSILLDSSRLTVWYFWFFSSEKE